MLPVSTPLSLTASTSAEIDAVVKVEGALANEVGLIILTLLENFATNFKVRERVCVCVCVCVDEPPPTHPPHSKTWPQRRDVIFS